MQAWQKSLANAAHALLYILLVLMPLSGMLMTFYYGYSIKFYNLFTIAPSFIPKSKMMGDLFNSIHFASAYMITALIVLHVAGALVHHFYYKDNVLKRML